MTEHIRTPDTNFVGLADFPYKPHYHEWQDLRMHYVDEGPKDAPVMLMVHGMPTWSYLYRHVIPGLLDAGYRCVLPDHMGFGRSDKPMDANWYTIARHTEILTSLINALDLKDITLICQDWGGPIGLAQAVFMPERFTRLTIMNTFLHHPEYEYSEAILSWVQNWHEGGLFCREKPDMGALMLLSAGLVERDKAIAAIVGKAPLAELKGEALATYQAFRAPIKDMPDEAYNGMRRFPLSICCGNHEGGNGSPQTHFYNTLLNWKGPAHFIWGCTDDIFTEAWGKKWAAQMKGTFSPIEDAGHFLQNTHGKELTDILLARISEE